LGDGCTSSSAASVSVFVRSAALSASTLLPCEEMTRPQHQGVPVVNPRAVVSPDELG
jgi:hypothetical protein